MENAQRFCEQVFRDEAAYWQNAEWSAESFMQKNVATTATAKSPFEVVEMAGDRSFVQTEKG